MRVIHISWKIVEQTGITIKTIEARIGWEITIEALQKLWKFYQSLMQALLYQ